jgi:hypothetical protein
MSWFPMIPAPPLVRIRATWFGMAVVEESHSTCRGRRVWQRLAKPVIFEKEEPVEEKPPPPASND